MNLITILLGSSWHLAPQVDFVKGISNGSYYEVVVLLNDLNFN
jgi:hypothetical protein